MVIATAPARMHPDWFVHVHGWRWLIVAAAVAGLGALLLAIVSVRHDPPHDKSSGAVPRAVFVAVVALVILAIAVGVVLVVFGVPKEGSRAAHNVDHRFTLLGHLLKAAALAAVAAAATSILAAIVLRPTRVRRNVRRAGQWFATQAQRDPSKLRGRPWGMAGNLVLWLTASSLQIKDFGGQNATGDSATTAQPDDGIDPAGVSNAMAGFLRGIGSPGAIGAPDRVDPRLALAPFEATTISQDVEKALSDAPYGKAAAALLSLAERLLPRERLFVSGYVLRSAQRGPGVTLTLARADGGVVDSETIWSSDFEPGIVAPDAAIRAVISPTLVLALAAAVWVTFALARRSGERLLNPAFGTSSWESFALVRVGLQGAARRPARLTRAIYARAVEADPGNHTAVYNLGLIETRALDDRDLATANAGVERLTGLYDTLTAAGAGPVPGRWRRVKTRLGALAFGVSPPAGPPPLVLSIVFNLTVAALNDHQTVRISSSRRPADDLSLWASRLCRQLVALERHLAMLERERPAMGDIDAPIGRERAISEIERPLLAVWASAAQQLGRPHHVHPRVAVRRMRRAGHPVGSDVSRYDHDELAAALETGNLGHRDLVFQYLSPRAVDARTRYNIACYWAAAGQYDTALRDLRRSLGPGTVGQGASHDPAFRGLRRHRPKAFRQAIASGRLFESPR